MCNYSLVCHMLPILFKTDIYRCVQYQIRQRRVGYMMSIFISARISYAWHESSVSSMFKFQFQAKFYFVIILRYTTSWEIKCCYSCIYIIYILISWDFIINSGLQWIWPTKYILVDWFAHFVVTWQIISNHRLIRLKRFILC